MKDINLSILDDKGLQEVKEEISQDISKELGSLIEEHSITINKTINETELNHLLTQILDDKEYPNLELQERYYTGEEYDKHYLVNNWIDIEGNEYGWLWVRCEEENTDIISALKSDIERASKKLLENNKEDIHKEYYLLEDKERSEKVLYLSRTVYEIDEHHTPLGEDNKYIDRKDLVIKLSKKDLLG